MTSSTAAITIVYEGSAIDGTMDVRELAPALLELGQLLERANFVLNGETTEVRVLVNADFRRGSFGVDLQLLQSVLETAKALLELGDRAGVRAPELVISLGLAYTHGVLGMLQTLKWLRGRPIKGRTVLADGNTQIEVHGDNNTVVVGKNTMPLLDDREVRLAMYEVLKPLADPGIDRFVVRDKGKEVETIGKSERPYFALPETTEAEDDVIENVFTARYRIITVQLAGELKWRLGQDDNRISASLDDEEFKQKVDSGEVSFTSGDVLEVRMRMVQSKTSESLRPDYHIVEVLEHHKRGSHVQPTFLAEAEPSDESEESCN